MSRKDFDRMGKAAGPSPAAARLSAIEHTIGLHAKALDQSFGVNDGDAFQGSIQRSAY